MRAGVLGSQKISVLCMVLPTMVSLAVSFPIYRATDVPQSNLASSRPVLSSSDHYSNRSFSVGSSYLLSSFLVNGEVVYCDSQTPYAQQPAQCQQATDTHRIAVFLPIALSTIAALLAALLAMRMFGNSGTER